MKDLQDKGIDAIYLLSIWAPSQYSIDYDINHIEDIRKDLPDVTKDDILGSGFAVGSYTVNPAIGSQQDMINFRARLAALNIQLYLDFVSNHAAVDAPIVSEHPEYFVKEQLKDSSL